MAMPKVKKKAPRIRAKTGLAAAALKVDKGWEGFKYYIHYEVDKKECGNVLKNYIKKNCSKADQKIINANPEYKFTMFSHYAAIIEWMRLEQPIDDRLQGYVDGLAKYIETLKEEGVPLLAEIEAAEKEKAASNVVVLTPQQRLANKVNQTIMADLDELEDQWIEGQETTLDVYNQFKLHALPASTVETVRRRIEGWLLDYSDAYFKRCEQAVEGYSHLKRPELKRRVKACEDMISDLDRIKDSAKAVRKPRIKKPQAAEKQVAKMLYLKESKDFKVTSVNPLTVVGAARVYIFNEKSKEITEYVTMNPDGFTVKGTTLQGWDTDLSRKIKLRKPDEFLPIVLSKTPKQIDTEWKKLTTKESQPNGRINKDCVILRSLLK